MYGQIPSQILQPLVGEGMFSKDRIQLAKRMSDLVDTLLLRDNELLRVLRVQRRRFKEGTYARRRIQEVLVAYTPIS